jgi:TPP-dependent indolepyruvate ferredoxin oxidoreductase alpha subunit
MTGFHPTRNGDDACRREDHPVNVPKLAESMGVSYRVVNPYDIKQCREALEAAVKEGPSLIVSSMLCFLLPPGKGKGV